MNTLRHKIEESIKKYDSDCWDYPLTDNNKVLADNFQSIAEDFSVKFTEWLSEYFHTPYLDTWESTREHDYNKRYTAKELLTEFKEKVYSPNIKEGEKG